MEEQRLKDLVGCSVALVILLIGALIGIGFTIAFIDIPFK